MQILARSQETSASLVEAFAATEYVVRAHCNDASDDERNNTPDEDVVIRIGQPTPALDGLLGGRRWVVITAHNPDGVRHSDDRNAAAQQALEQCLRELRPETMLPVCNHDPSGQWPDEPAWLLACDNFSAADALARRFGQRAVVAGQPGAAAALRIYGGSHDATGSAASVVS